MSFLQRLANLARGQFLAWRRGEEEPRVAEDELRPRRPVVDEDDGGADDAGGGGPADADRGHVAPAPVTPRKRRL